MNRNRNLCKKKCLKMMGVLLASAVVASGTGVPAVYGAEKDSRIEKSDKEIKDVVFLDGENGSDRNSGLDEEHAVKTFARAAKLAEEGWEIRVCGTVTVDDRETWKLPDGVSFSRADDFYDDMILVNGSLILKNVPVYESWISGEGTVEGALKESLVKVPSVITVEEPVLLGDVSLEQCQGEGTFSWAGEDRMLDQYETVCQVIFQPEDDQDYSQEDGWDEESRTVTREVTVQVLSLDPGDTGSSGEDADGDREEQLPGEVSGGSEAGEGGSGQDAGENGEDPQKTEGSQTGEDSGEGEESAGQKEEEGSGSSEGGTSGGDSQPAGENGGEESGSPAGDGDKENSGSEETDGSSAGNEGSDAADGGNKTSENAPAKGSGSDAGETSGDSSELTGSGTSEKGESQGEDGSDGQPGGNNGNTEEGISGEEGEASGPEQAGEEEEASRPEQPQEEASEENGQDTASSGETDNSREDGEEENGGLTEEELAEAEVVQKILEDLPEQAGSQDEVAAVVEATRAYLSLSDQQRSVLSQEAVKHLEILQQQSAGVNRESGGVSIEGDFPWYVQLQARERSSQEEASLPAGAGVDTLIYPYEIRLWDLMNQQEYKLNGQQVRLTMPVPDASSYSRLMVLHYLEDGSVEYITPVNNGDGTVSFLTTSFSPYSLAGSAVLVGNIDKLYQNGGAAAEGTGTGQTSSGNAVLGSSSQTVSSGSSTSGGRTGTVSSSGRGTSSGTSRTQAASTGDPQTPYLYAGLGIFAVVVLAGAAVGYRRSKQKKADEINQ